MTSTHTDGYLALPTSSASYLSAFNGEVNVLKQRIDSWSPLRHSIDRPVVIEATRHVLVSGMLACLAIVCLANVGCSSSNEAATEAQSSDSTTPVVQRNELTSNGAIMPGADSEFDESEPEAPSVSLDEADIRVLFLGNSHTYLHNMTQMVAALANLDDDPDKMVAKLPKAGGAFLVNHLANEDTVELIKNGKWDVVVLQGQKYSTTGRYTYPTDAAKELTRLAKEHGARVVMFPEWRRRGHDEEGQRVHRLHESIAKETGAEVAPVGLAWDAAFAAQPNLVLHAADGNHCNPQGAYLTACVLYTTITGRDPQGIDYRARIRMSDRQRQFLQRIAWETCQRKDDAD